MARGSTPVASLTKLRPRQARRFGAMRGRARVTKAFFEPLPAGEMIAGAELLDAEPYVLCKTDLDPGTSASAADQQAVPKSSFAKATEDLAEAFGGGGHGPRFCAGHMVPR